MATRLCGVFLNPMDIKNSSIKNGTHTHMIISLLTFFLCFVASVSAQEQKIGDDVDIQKIAQPNIKRQNINEANIDTEDFEIGTTVGIIAIEDFSSGTVVGLRFAYHINEDFFVEANAGKATAGQTSFEVLSGGAPFLTDDEREYSFYDLSLGFNLNGEVFLTKNLAFNSATYFTLGAGSTKFGGDEHFTFVLGAGYRLLLTDYLAVHFDVRDHVFDSELIAEKKSTHNIEYGLGLTFFF